MDYRKNDVYSFTTLLLFGLLLINNKHNGCNAAIDTLFDFEDPIVQFTKDNFTSTITGSHVAWIIDFYSSWCGHCQRFAPVWVELSKKIQGWQSVVRVGSLACSDPKNSAVCRLYNIWRYPIVKFFPSNAANGDRGSNYNGIKTVDALRNGILDYLNASTALTSGLSLKPVRSLGEVRGLRTQSTKSIFLVATENTADGRRLAKGIILDVSEKYPEIIVAWSHRNFLGEYNITEFPSLYKVTERAITRVNGKGEFISIISNEGDYHTPSTVITTSGSRYNTPVTVYRNGITTDRSTVMRNTVPIDTTVPYNMGQTRRQTTIMPDITTGIDEYSSYTTRGSNRSNITTRPHHRTTGRTRRPTTRSQSKENATERRKRPSSVTTSKPRANSTERKRKHRPTTKKKKVPTANRPNTRGTTTNTRGTTNRVRVSRKPSVGTTENTNNWGNTYTTTFRPTTLAYSPSDGLHSQDLDSNIYYSFWVEIAAHERITGSAFKTLKQYVRILGKYHTGSTYVVKFLKRVHNWLSNIDGPLTGEQWVRNITNLQRRNAFVPQRVQWTGCQGSLDRFRGYPCSLWMTFHSLSINAYLAEAHRSRKPHDPQNILIIMREYIRHFFGCRECARHFTEHSRYLEQDVTTGPDGILWLWETHNTVNNQLHNDPTEDPSFAKIQFPVGTVCQDCRRFGSGRFNTNVTWDEEKILAYVVNFYRPENIIRDSKPYIFKRGKSEARILNKLKNRAKTTRSVKNQATTTPSGLRKNTNNKRRKKHDNTVNQTNSLVNHCKVDETKWSSCSKSCGVGVSSRISNDNNDCQSYIQFRICQIRPCNAKFQASANASCGNDKTVATFRSSSKSRLLYKSCHSIDKFVWRYCGHCSNKCCVPVQEETVSINMECKENRQWYKIKADVMKIGVCRCTKGRC